MKQYLLVVLAILLVGIVSATGTITLSVPSTALPSSTAAITHTVSGVTGKWGAIVNENLAGGCTFPDGSSNYKDAFLSSGGSSRQLAITTPPSGTCTLTGYYQFSDDTQSTTITQKSITISVTPVTCTTTSRSCMTSDGKNGTQTCSGTNVWSACNPETNWTLYIGIGVVVLVVGYFILKK